MTTAIRLLVSHDQNLFAFGITSFAGLTFSERGKAMTAEIGMDMERIWNKASCGICRDNFTNSFVGLGSQVIHWTTEWCYCDGTLGSS